MRLASRLDLARLEPGRFGRLSLWVLLALAAMLMNQLPLDHLYQGVRVGTVSAAGLLPEPLRTGPSAFPLLHAVFLVCALLWAFTWAVPGSAWGATLAFTLYVSLYLENVPHWDHKCHVVNLILFVYCAWYHIHAAAIRRAARARRLWTAPIYPRWVYLASVFAICCHYMLAGVSKLVEGQGVRWADGLTLQMWVLARGDGFTGLGAQVVNHRGLALALQATVLAVELAMPLALLFPWFRVAAGLFFTGFHVSARTIFPDVVFTANMVVVCTFFLLPPVLTWGERWALPTETSAESEQEDCEENCE